VRESEFANAQNAAGVPERIRTQWNNILRGEKLGPNQREDFVNRSHKLFQSQLGSQTNLENEFRGIAERYGIRPEDVVIDYAKELRSGGVMSEKKRMKFDAQGNPVE
jgi:hypothetical protein